MGINNEFFYFYCTLNLIAILLGLLRTDLQRIKNDLKHFFRINSWLIFIGLLLIFFAVLPLTIPYSIKNIINNKRNNF
jgi:hypothetical protein